MRKINTEDVFKMARLIKETGIKKEITDALTAGRKDGADTEQIGIDAVFGIIGACAEKKVENQFYELIAGITEKKNDDVRNQTIETTVEDIKKIAEENNLVNFFKTAFKLNGNMKQI